jgi:hypothetical protein
MKGVEIFGPSCSQGTVPVFAWYVLNTTMMEAFQDIRQC